MTATKFQFVHLLDRSPGVIDNNANYIDGTSSVEIFASLRGDDVVFGDGSRDYIQGNQGNDMIFGDVGGDTLNGGAGNDNFFLV